MTSKPHDDGHTNAGVFARFIKSEVAGSVILLVCTLLALAWANSPWFESYLHLLHTKVGVSWGDAKFALSLQHWINDGLMVVFFFVVGLELKRELLLGHLSSRQKAILPVMAALGGMIVPAVIYASFNFRGDGARGWGIPMATDIAFSLGVLAILGTRVPPPLKILLTAAAIADDLGAVIVIAVFYTETIWLAALLVAGGLLGLLVIATRALKIRRLGLILVIILGIWAAVFASGIHATVAGIIVALIVPVSATMERKDFVEIAKRRLAELESGQSADGTIIGPEPLEAYHEFEDASRQLQPAGLRLEHYFHPVTTYFVLPLFALANAGIVMDQSLISATTTPVGMGVFFGLLLGKPIGFLMLSWLAVRGGLAQLPKGTSWAQVAGVGCLAGIGFTMSLFVTELAFSSPEPITSAKSAILAAS